MVKRRRRFLLSIESMNLFKIRPNAVWDCGNHGWDKPLMAANNAAEKATKYPVQPVN